MAGHIDSVLLVVEQLNEQIELANEQLRQVVEQDPVCKRLMTVPGVGPVVPLRFMAVVDQVERFGSAHDLMSYLGLTPGERSSSTHKRRTSITKAGASDLRAALVQGAWAATRQRRRDPMVQWALQLAERRNRKIAVTALARKIAGMLFAIWRDGTTYDPNRGASPSRAETTTSLGRPAAG